MGPRHLVGLVLVGLHAVGMSACSAQTTSAHPVTARLGEVEGPAAPLRVGLDARRTTQIARLHAYAARGEFPQNPTPVVAHMFKDDAGRLCAVANLLHADGLDELVLATARTKNDLAIADVVEGPMMDWVLGSGFTQEELVRIQLPLPPQEAHVRPATQLVPVAVAPSPVRPARETIRQHLATVEAELRANADASLTMAVLRRKEASRDTTSFVRDAS